MRREALILQQNDLSSLPTYRLPSYRTSQWLCAGSIIAENDLQIRASVGYDFEPFGITVGEKRFTTREIHRLQDEITQTKKESTATFWASSPTLRLLCSIGAMYVW